MIHIERTTVALLLVAIWSLPPVVVGATDRGPNVIVFLADDQGWGDLSLHGNPNLATPNIDSLARQGAEVTHFYVCAVCSPTRAEFLTGRYHTRMGVRGTSVGEERFSPDEQTIAQVFQAAGYATAAFGKWHSGMQWPYHPNARGFEEFYGFCSGHWDNYFSPMLEHNGRIVQGNGFIVDDLTQRAIEFIDKQRDRPFFVYLPYNTPHSPMQVPEKFWQEFKNKSIEPDPAEQNARRQVLDHTRAALAMCENIDDNVGRMLQYLDRRGLSEHTIVVYFSDNGPNGYRFNGGMRGRKGTTFEGGLRSPCLIRYPAQIPAGSKVASIAAAIDLLPTLTDLAGVPVDSPRPLDGISIAPVLRQQQDHLPDRSIISIWNQKASIRSQRWRLHRNGPLFDLENDPGEINDVSAANPEISQRLEQSLSEYINHAIPAAVDRPFVLGYPQATFTQFPARDAVPHGGIERNNRFPNCTYMTKWTHTGQRIVWDAEVPVAGEFEVQMYYASASQGSVVELSFGDQRLRSTIVEPNDAVETGMERDRFRRQEGYTKDWKPLNLGRIQLATGRGPLTLRAIKVAGDQVADMRLLMFRRID